MAGNRTIREGINAGLLGAAAVAVWFFVVDLVLRRPLYTPQSLGHAVLGTLGLERGQSAFEVVTFYTILHVVAFCVTGIVIAWVVNASEREPSHLAGLFLIFVAFEAGFHLILFTLRMAGQAIDLPWYQVGVANLLAALVMGRSLLRAHPDALHQLNDALAGRT